MPKLECYTKFVALMESRMTNPTRFPKVAMSNRSSRYRVPKPVQWVLALAVAAGLCFALDSELKRATENSQPIKFITTKKQTTCSETVTEEVRNPDGTVHSTKSTRTDKPCKLPTKAPHFSPVLF